MTNHHMTLCHMASGGLSGQYYTRTQSAGFYNPIPDLILSPISLQWEPRYGGDRGWLIHDDKPACQDWSRGNRSVWNPSAWRRDWTQDPCVTRDLHLYSATVPWGRRPVGHPTPQDVNLCFYLSLKSFEIVCIINTNKSLIRYLSDI